MLKYLIKDVTVVLYVPNKYSKIILVELINKYLFFFVNIMNNLKINLFN